MRKILYVITFLFFSFTYGQEPEKLNSSEVFKKIQELNFLGSVLYVAAHPDDENTRLISYLNNELNARTAYLSLTRGDGGQNLIGPQLRELLGLIRTQELLAARQIDGGEQFFSRANDFGYSKHPEETLDIWNEQEVLSDIVWMIRKFQPDVIINRFDHKTPGTTHGHHTASAILSVKAFELADNKSAFPEQVEKVGTWKPQKLFFNTSPWFYESEEAFENADKSDFIEFNTGVYFPLFGSSNTEISSLSRSQHRSQGFGSTGSRGNTKDFIKLIDGEHPQNNADLFAGINTTWSRIEGGEEIGDILYEVENNYDFENPSASIPELIRAYQLIQQLDNEHWKRIKTEEIKTIIAAAAGLYLEAIAGEPTVVQGEEVSLRLEAINRSKYEMQLNSIELFPVENFSSVGEGLGNNEPFFKTLEFQVPQDASLTTPYWLKESGTLGMYTVKNQELRGLPQTPKKFEVVFNLNIEGSPITFRRPLIFKKNDPVEGEVYLPFEVVPKVSVALENEVEIFANQKQKILTVRVQAMQDSLEGVLELNQPKGWQIVPASYDFDFSEEGEVANFDFTVTPPAGQEQALLIPRASTNGKIYSKEVIKMDFEHIPVQTLVLPAETKLVKLDIQKKGQLIGYIEGAGDVVPEALEQIGYEVQVIAPREISAEKLENFDAVVVGIRAYNTVNALEHKQQQLFNYVEAGGTLIAQYNTNRDLKVENLAPYPLHLSRDRVTDENAPVSILAANHPVLNTPNKITNNDFEGWVQERGLYFPDEWAAEFTPILSINDEGESPKQGSLLVAEYGEGHFVYTGLSFFRQFPAGVPGAFRLFANLISLGN